MTVQDYINTFALEHDNPYEDAVLLKWINLVESNVYADNIKEYRVQNYARTLDVYQFDLPAGVDFNDVKSLRVNGVLYKKKDVRAYREKYSYWYEGGKLCIYPACSETDSPTDPKIRLVYQNKPVTKLIANIATDTLLINDRFIDIYDYYLMAKIAYLAGENADYQNHMNMFNSRVFDYEQWWDDNRPQNPETDIIAAEDGEYATASFDSE
jgi:hypothetical protein